MTQPSEPTATAPQPTATAPEPTTAGQPTTADTEPTPAGRAAPESREAADLADARRAARQLLGAIFITAGIAHLTHQRFYRSLLPYWLVEARREIDVATGTAEVFGGVLLFIPRLRKLARWTNLVLLTPSLLAAVGEVRHPSRLGSFSQRRAVLNPVGPLMLAPGHAGLVSLLWWATQD
jgi:uncharacterized membrane protein